jgi:hypothetical protein
MDKRRKAIDKDAQRIAFYKAIAAGELTFQEAVKRMRALSRFTQQEFADH